MNSSQVAEHIETKEMILEEDYINPSLQRSVKNVLTSKTGALLAVILCGILLKNDTTSRSIQLVFEGFINSLFISTVFAAAVLVIGYIIVAIERKSSILSLNSMLEITQSFNVLPKYLCFTIVICLPVFETSTLSILEKYYIKLFCIGLLLELPSTILNIRHYCARTQQDSIAATDLYFIGRTIIWAFIVYDIIGGFLFTSPSEKLFSLGNVLTDVYSGGVVRTISILNCIALIAALENYLRPKLVE